MAAVAAAGATHAGLILVPDTPRHLDLEQAANLAAVARGKDLKPVGVFRDHDPEELTRIAQQLSLAAVQLHG